MIPWIVAGVSLLAVGCGARSELEVNSSRNLPGNPEDLDAGAGGSGGSSGNSGFGGLAGAGGTSAFLCDSKAERPDRWWEGAWCHAGGVDKTYSVAAFELVGDRASLEVDGVPHPGSIVRLFGGKQEDVAEVVFNELGPDDFRLRYFLTQSNSRPRFTYIDPCTLSAEYYIDGAGTAIFKRSQDIDACGK